MSFSQSSGSLKGIVKDATTKETLIGANVVIDGTSIGTSTDLDGAYFLPSVPAGDHTIVASYIGYDNQEIQVTVEAGKTLKLDIETDYASLEGVEVIITAQAEAQVAAINRQLASNTILNVVSAKKIQELPTANAAEAIGRLPGVSILRSGGEGSKVVVRGLAPKYNRIQIEGVQMASTGGNDRSTDLSMISPYMLEGIEVSKAALPNQEANALGGSVNFVLRSAPKDPKFDMLLQTGYGGLKKQFGDYKVVLGGSRRLLNDKLGVFAQIDVENRKRPSYELGVNYTNQTSPDDQSEVDVSSASIIVSDYDRQISRLGGVFVLDYKLPNGKIKLSNFTSKIGRQTERRFESLRPLERSHEYGYQNDESDLLVMNNSLRVENTFGKIKLTGGVSYAYSTNKLPNGVTFTGREEAGFQEGLNVTSSPSAIAALAKNDISDARVSRISRNLFDTKETQYGADLNLSYPLNLSKKISVLLTAGGKYRNLEKAYDFTSQRLEVRFGGEGAEIRKAIVENFPELRDFVSNDISVLPYELFVDPNYRPANFLGGDYTIKNIPDADFVNKIAEVADGIYFTDFPATNKDDYSGSEDYSAAYIMGEIQFGDKLTLIPGVRYERNKTNYKGVRGNSAALLWSDGYLFSDTTIANANSFVLPMIHAKFKPVEWFDLRLAYTKTLARPDFRDIIPSWDRQLTNVDWNDPFLKTSVSTNFDAYASFYQNKLGLVTIGGFSKEIAELIYNAGRSTILNNDQATEYGLPTSTAGQTISRTINNPYPVKLYGLEVEWQTRFWYLDNFLNGFVFNINYTHTISEVKYPRTILDRELLTKAPWVIINNIDTFYVDRLIAQPNNILNASIGYDFKGLSTRFSMTYQDDIFSATNFWERHRSSSASLLRFDLSLKQKLPMKGWEVLFNLSNLNSSIERDINSGTGYPKREQHYAYTVDIGIRYRL